MRGPVTWICVPSDVVDPGGLSCAKGVDAQPKSLGRSRPVNPFWEHRNPVVQLEHLDLTARGLPLSGGARQDPHRQRLRRTDHLLVRLVVTKRGLSRAPGLAGLLRDPRALRLA